MSNHSFFDASKVMMKPTTEVHQRRASALAPPTPNSDEGTVARSPHEGGDRPQQAGTQADSTPTHAAQQRPNAAGVGGQLAAQPSRGWHHPVQITDEVVGQEVEPSESRAQ